MSFPKTITHLQEKPENPSEYKMITVLEYISTEKVIYNLVSIKELDNKWYKEKYQNLKHLNISNNSLPILKLKDYKYLETILASNNQIYEVELNLPSLSKLDLSRNNLKRMFDLSNIKYLTELNLSQNSIRELSFDLFKSVKATLSVLDLSENLIEFNDVKEFFNFAETFGKSMKELTVFNVDGNPFTNKKKYKDNYQSLIRANFLNLKILNSRDIAIKSSKNEMHNMQINQKLLKEKMLEMEKQEEDPVTLDNNITEYGKQVTLQMINKKLLAINQFGKLNDKTLEVVENMIDMYVANVGSGSKKNENEDQTELDEFEMFLDHIEKIIDSVSGFEKRLYALIGKFSTIKYGKFTSRALSCIKQRISSESSNDVYEVLSQINSFLKKTPEDKIPGSIIDGLQLFLDEPKFINHMKVIMKQIMIISGKIDNDIEYNARKAMNDNVNDIYMKLYCSIISFFAKAIQFSDFVAHITGKETFIKACAFNLKKILYEPDDDIIANGTILLILRNLLFIIRTICLMQNTEMNKQGSDSGVNSGSSSSGNSNNNINNNNKQLMPSYITQIIGTGIRDRIEQKLKNLLQSVYKKMPMNDNQQEMKMREKELSKKQECTSLIQCFGALLSGADDVAKYLENRSLPMKIVEILGQNEIIDPLLIQAACDFTYFILQNKIINTSETKFNIIAAKLYNFRCLIPFLFSNTNEFTYICVIAEKYGEKTCERGKPLELKYMNSEMMNNFFISITRLMSFFGYHSQTKSPIQAKCEDICNEMNNLKRDEALTNCFLLPDENVKLSVAECFYSINVEQLEPEELIAIYKQLTFLSSITGKMQHIVAIIFLIMNKWFLHNLKEGKFTNIETCKEAIFLAMSLLTKNDLKKTAFDSKHSKKTFLSAVLVMFLVNISCFQETRKYFSDPKNKNDMYKVIQSEEESVNSIEIGFPLEVEKCHCGWNVNNILTAMKGGCVNPYNYVSLRIMMHLGDVLINKCYPMYNLDYQLSNEEIMHTLAEEMKRREKARVVDEAKNWREIKEKINTTKYKHCVVLPDKLLEQQQLAFVKGFQIILEFVLCQCTETQISKLSRVWENKFSKGIDMIKYSTYEPPKEEVDDNNNINSGNTGNYNSSTYNSYNDDNEHIDFNETQLYEKFIYFLREEDYDQTTNADPYNTAFTYIKNEKFQFERYGQAKELKRVVDDEHPNNPYLRSLFISAFFRCIYSVLEHSHNTETKNEMIRTLYFKDNIRTLCLLAECTKFAENNIATKFLIIMKHVLRNTKVLNTAFPNADKKNEISNDLLNKYGKISYMIKKIVRVFKKDINIEKDEHKLLLSEVCQCSALIISQLQLIPFDHKDAKPLTISSMIDYEVITVFISVIKDYMNKEAETKLIVNDDTSSTRNKNKSYGEKLLQEMVSINSNIIGEYMSRCRYQKYDILESFTRSYMFERCKMRKTLIKEIIDYSNLATYKSYLYDKLNNKMINLIAHVLLTKYRRDKGSSEKKIMVITEDSLMFIEADDDDDDGGNIAMYRGGYINIDDNSKIMIKTITKVITFDYLNHMLIETNEDQTYGFFFYKNMNVSASVKNILNEINNKIVFYDDLQTMPLIEVPLLNNASSSTTTSPTADDTTTTNNNNNEQQQETLNDVIKDESVSKSVFIYCKFEFKDMCDVFSNWFKKKEVIKDEKTVIIQDGKISIYEEKFDEWEKIRPSEIFRAVASFGGRKHNLNIGSFKHCFKFLTDYDVSEFESMELIDADKLVLKRKNGTGVVFNIIDDMSYVKFKHALNLKEIFE